LNRILAGNLNKILFKILTRFPVKLWSWAGIFQLFIMNIFGFFLKLTSQADIDILLLAPHLLHGAILPTDKNYDYVHYEAKDKLLCLNTKPEFHIIEI
jgi:hypothetical protein